MVLVDSHGISRVPRYSGTRHESARCRLRGCHPLWPIVPDRSTNKLIGNSPVLHRTGPTTPPCKHDGLGYVRVRSPLLAESLLISVPVGTEMVHFPTLPSWTYGFSPGYPGMTPGGFPHSEISGSKLVCSCPKLIAAYHVLHRLLAPRHSPHALSSLTMRTPDLPSRRPRRRRDEIEAFTHCCVVGKNYRLQDVQLSKSPPPQRTSRCVQSVPRQPDSPAGAPREASTWWRIPGSNR